MKEILYKKIQAVMNSEFPDFPCVIQESPEDSRALWVQVFSVPETEVEIVEDFIDDLEDRLPPDHEVFLLPMVKSLDVTRQYYPQYLSSILECDERVIQCIQKIIEKLENEWKYVTTQGPPVRVFESVTSEIIKNMNTVTIQSESLHSCEPQRPEVPEEEELTLAA